MSSLIRALWIPLLLLFVRTTAADWPQFRGPEASGLTTERQLPTEWGPEKNIKWKIELPGVAWSQPIVVGDKIFVTTAITENQRKPAVGGGFGGRGGGSGGAPQGEAGGFRRAPEGAPPAGEAGGFRRADAPKREGDAKREEPPAKASDSKAFAQAKGQERQPDARCNEDRVKGRGGFGPGGFGGGKGGFGGGFGGFGRGGSPPNAVYQWKLMCLDRATGKTLWEQLAKEGKPTIPTQPQNTYASETPLCDGERVYAYFGMTGLYCYDLEGKLLWSKSLGSFPMTGGWGTGSSPAIDGERLFVQCDNEEKSFLVALDKHSGDELWKVERTESSNWCTPYIWKNKLRTELVTSGNRVRSYDPATGKLLWEYAKIGGGCKATPVGDAELLYVGTGGGGGGMGGGFSGKGGFGGAPGGNTPNAAGAGRAANSPIIAIRAGASGDVSLQGTETSNQHVAWSIERAGPPMASPLLYRGCLYSLDQRGGIIGCYDAKTGQQHYRERLPDARGFTASPWAADGMVFCLDESGQTFVLKAGPKLEVLATNKLADMFWSSVAIAKGELLLRGIDRLYCIAGQ